MLYSWFVPRRLINFRIDPEQLAALQAIKQRDGIPLSEQVRRAIRRWIESRGIKADRRRARTRRQS
jgi:hypothetical protein